MTIMRDHSALWSARFTDRISYHFRHEPGQSPSDAAQLSQRCASGGAPQTAAEKRQTLYWGIPFWLCLLGFPMAAALSAKAAQLSALEIFLSTAGVIFLLNLVDWLILDWLLVCTITPRFMVLPGTEGMAGYKNYRMHFRGFLIGTGLAAVIGFLITIILMLL